jgi:hypothetical protein
VFVGTTIIQVVLIKEKKGRWTHRNMSTEYAAGADVVPSKITGRGRPPLFSFLLIPPSFLVRKTSHENVYRMSG